MSEQPFHTAHLSEIADRGRTRAVRQHFGIEAFGVNAFTGEPGEEVVNEHDELGALRPPQEELYLVTEGRARFTLDDEEVDAPTGTLVFARPATRRRAVAAEPGTVVLVFGGPRGEPFTVSEWERYTGFWPLYTAKDYEGAVAYLVDVLEREPDNVAVLYNLACCESLAGQRDHAVKHLRLAVNTAPGMAGVARDDADFEPLRGDPDFEALTTGPNGQLARRPGTGDGSHAVAALSDVETQPGVEGSTWIRIRKHLDVGAFGVNAYRAEEAGGRVIEDHTEENLEHQELYLVIGGRARFTLGEEEVDAPAGTFVFLRDPAIRRGAHAEEPGTTVLAIGARPGEAFEVSPWEDFAEAGPLFQTKEYDRAIEVLNAGLEKHPDDPGGLYNLACCESMLGRSDEALEHLARAVELDPRFAGFARDDEDFEPLREDPRFSAIAGQADPGGPGT